MKRSSSDLLKAVFAPGNVTATGERVFQPIRKKVKEENGNEYETDNGVKVFEAPQPASYMSEEDVKLLRMENHIEVEGDGVVNPITSFQSIGLNPVFIRRFQERNILKPKPVQMQGIPLILSGRDVIIHSETGSGKTLAFLIPLIMRLQKCPMNEGLSCPYAIILELTRELANQTYKECCEFLSSPFSFLSDEREVDDDLPLTVFNPNGHLKHRVVGMWGGENSSQLYNAIGKGVDVIVSTPGRLVDLVNRHVIEMNQYVLVFYFVIDEADKAVDASMENQIRYIASRLPETGVQTILCSATFQIAVQRLINSCVVNPILLRINDLKEDQGGLSKDVTIHTIVASSSNRFEALLAVIRSIPTPPVLIFVNSIASIESLTIQLRQEQFHCCGIHSDYPQELRETIIRAFQENGIDILIASTLLERGMDLNVDNVILYELPDTIDKFKHRAGRTGRAGKKGDVYAFVSKECKILKDYKQLLRQMKQEIPDKLNTS